MMVKAYETERKYEAETGCKYSQGKITTSKKLEKWEKRRGRARGKSLKIKAQGNNPTRTNRRWQSWPSM